MLLQRKAKANKSVRFCGPLKWRCSTEAARGHTGTKHSRHAAPGMTMGIEQAQARSERKPSGGLRGRNSFHASASIADRCSWLISKRLLCSNAPSTGGSAVTPFAAGTTSRISIGWGPGPRYGTYAYVFLRELISISGPVIPPAAFPRMHAVPQPAVPAAAPRH